MNLRTDEIGKAENTLKELHSSLVEKKKKISEEYELTKSEADRLWHVAENTEENIKSIAKAYKEITGKEL